MCEGSRKEKNAAQVSIRYYVKAGLDKNFMNLSLKQLKLISQKLKELNSADHFIVKPKINLKVLRLSKGINYYVNLVLKNPKYKKYIQKCIVLKEYESKKVLGKEKKKAKVAVQYHINSGLNKNLANLLLKDLKTIQEEVQKNELQDLDYYLNLAHKNSDYKTFVSKCIKLQECKKREG